MLQICSTKTELPANWLTKGSIKYALYRVRHKEAIMFLLQVTRMQ